MNIHLPKNPVLKVVLGILLFPVIWLFIVIGAIWELLGLDEIGGKEIIKCLLQILVFFGIIVLLIKFYK